MTEPAICKVCEKEINDYTDYDLCEFCNDEFCNDHIDRNYRDSGWSICEECRELAGKEIDVIYAKELVSDLSKIKTSCDEWNCTVVGSHVDKNGRPYKYTIMDNSSGDCFTIRYNESVSSALALNRKRNHMLRSREITDVPPGKYEIRIWHGLLGEKKGGSVDVEAGGAATVELSF